MPDSSMPVVTVKQLLLQAKFDIQGKEVQNGYTLTYVWMANQLGHFTIGFLLTLLSVWAVQLLGAPCLGCTLSPFVETDLRVAGLRLADIRLGHAMCVWVVVLAAAHVVFWSLKELWDYRRARSDASGSAFDFKGWDVFLDAATAVGFIAWGVVVAFCSLLSWWLALVAFVVGAVVALFPAHYWLSRKYCFQRAKIPYVFRLADFDGQFEPDPRVAADTVHAFLEGRDARFTCLLVFGEPRTGRTELSTGILTEHCFGVKKGRYMTWAKFVENAHRTAREQEGEQAWPWQDSDVVVLDDVVRSMDGAALEAPGDIAAQLAALGPSTIEALRARRLAWVLGPAGDEVMQAWTRELARVLGTPPDRFCSVNLVLPRPQPEFRSPRRRKLLTGFTGH